MILGGDFNEPSHLDWIRETKDLYDHHGLIVPWTVPLMLDNAGFADAYRVRYPDVLNYPGFTFPADNPLIAVEKLTWAPKLTSVTGLIMYFLSESTAGSGRCCNFWSERKYCLWPAGRRKV